MQRVGGDRRIGEDEGEHGRHVRCDHAGALGHPGDRYLDAADRRLGRRDLGKRVRGHDRLRGAKEAIGRGFAHQRLEHAGKLLGIERFTDDARRGDENLARAQARGRGGEVRGAFHRFGAGLAGEGVGIAGIDDERAGLAAAELCAAPIDRRRRAFGFGEDARDLRALIEQREHHIGAALVADARRAGRKSYAVNGRDFGKAFRGERGNFGLTGHARAPE